jgi:hypothetical protein
VPARDGHAVGGAEEVLLLTEGIPVSDRLAYPSDFYSHPDIAGMREGTENCS